MNYIKACKSYSLNLKLINLFYGNCAKLIARYPNFDLSKINDTLSQVNCFVCAGFGLYGCVVGVSTFFVLLLFWMAAVLAVFL